MVALLRYKSLDLENHLLLYHLSGNIAMKFPTTPARTETTFKVGKSAILSDRLEVSAFETLVS